MRNKLFPSLSFMMAAFGGHLRILELLAPIEDVMDQTDKSGASALHWACDGGQADVVEWLLRRGMDVNAVDVAAGWTPLMRCGE